MYIDLVNKQAEIDCRDATNPFNVKCDRCAGILCFFHSSSCLIKLFTGTLLPIQVLVHKSTYA